jgi:hypothetical protein
MENWGPASICIRARGAGSILGRFPREGLGARFNGTWGTSAKSKQNALIGKQILTSTPVPGIVQGVVHFFRRIWGIPARYWLQAKKLPILSHMPGNARKGIEIKLLRTRAKQATREAGLGRNWL